MPDDLRTHDLVLYGATGFVGELTAAHLAGHAPPGARIALAGRSRERLAAVRARLPGPARDWPLVQADATDPASLAALAGATRVVVTTVGPYARYGLPLVEACARAGTHYADLTGEVLFVREAVDRYDALARESGARIVHACGYDSIPSDLAVLLLHERAAADGAGGLRDVRLVATARGGLSGGTIDSIRAQVDTMRRDPAARRTAADPFALSPDRAAEPDTPQPSATGRPARTGDGRWTAPFIMAAFNTRIVRRSNALQGWAYGRELRYSEVMGTGRGPLGAVAAAGVSAGLFAFLAAMTRPPHPRPARPRAPRPGHRAERGDPRTWVVPDGGRRLDRERCALPRRDQGPWGPGLRRDRGDARAERAGPGAGRRPPAGPRRFADPGDGAGHGARRAVARGGAHVRGGAGLTVPL